MNLKNHEIKYLHSTCYGDVWRTSVYYNEHFYIKDLIFMGYPKSEIKKRCRQYWLERFAQMK